MKTFPHAVNTVVTDAAAKTLIPRSPDENLKCTGLEVHYIGLTVNLYTYRFYHMHHIQNKSTRTGKKESKLIFQHPISDLAERHSIPPSLVIDQTPLKYAPIVNQALSGKGSKRDNQGSIIRKAHYSLI